MLVGYDGSDGARRAVEEAGQLLPAGPAVVLCVWQSARALLFDPLPGATPAERVLQEVDERAEQRVEQLAAEGVELARSVGFDAQPLVRPVVTGPEREENSAWRTLVQTADELDARVVVLGSRGRSGIKTALLGSVSQGVIAHTRRAVLVVAQP